MVKITYDNNLEIIYSNYKIIIADTDLNTFNELTKIKEDFCFINLSSDFAVNFVMEYEKVDYLLISNRINNLNNLIIKAQKKKVKIFILGKDIEYPLNFVKVKDLLINEIKNNIAADKKTGSFKKLFKGFFSFRPKDAGKHINLISSKSKIEKSEKKGEKKPIKKSGLSPKFVSAEIAQVNKEKESEENNPVLRQLTKDKNIEQNNFSDDILAENITGNDHKDKDVIEKVDGKTLNCQLSNYPKYSTGRKSAKTEYQIRTIKQKIIAVTKAKGGVGSTIISIFLGLLFKDLKTLIIDLNFSEGGSDLGYYLDIPKTPNLMVFTEGFDKNAFSGSVLNIIDNLDVIQSPPTYMQSKEIDLKDIYSLTDIARKKYDLIIFDLPNNINEFYLGVVDLADLLVMVTDCTNGSIGRLLNINSKYIYDELEKILIINKFNKNNSLKISIDSLKDYFKIENITTLKELDILNSKSDFKLFNFNNFDDFKNLSNIATEVLTK